jgi:PKD repeat protein
VFSVLVSEDNLAPVLAPIGDKTVDEGSLLTFTATAVDGDCPANSLMFNLAPGAPLGATINSSTGAFAWTPTSDQGPGVYLITVRVTDGTLIDSKTFQVTVIDMPGAPVADANGPYTGIVNFPVSFDGTGSADPDGDPLSYLWDFGDGSSGTGATPAHPYPLPSGPGGYIVTLCVSDPGGLSDCDVTTATIVDLLSARVFTVGGNKTIRLGSGKPQTCVQIEPVGGAFDVSEVDLTSLVMRFGGSEIPAIADKTAVVGDKDHNGISEITACFSKEDLRVLFAGLPSGQNQVDVLIRGMLVGGAPIEGAVTLQVNASGGGGLAASIVPNPLNPRANLTFATSEAGWVKVQMFDLHGRLVRTLMESSSAPAGYHDVAIDGLDARGQRMASGMYYLLIRTSADGEERKAITILK